MKRKFPSFWFWVLGKIDLIIQQLRNYFGLFILIYLENKNTKNRKAKRREKDDFEILIFFYGK